MAKKLSAEQELGKRIWEAWGSPTQMFPQGEVAYKRLAIVAARIAMGKSPDGKRDEIWDALVEALDLHPEQITSNLRGRLNDACRQLREVSATPEQIIAKAKSYRYQHPDWELTAQALCTHWASLRVGADSRRPTIDTELVREEVELVPPPPGFWDEVASATKVIE